MAMHIEPGVVDGAKLAIGYATAVGFMGLTFRYLIKDILKGHANRLLVETIVTAFITLLSFEVFPHPTVWVSEVHIILGSTLLLLFGLVPAALGMASGLLLQGMLFALSDLPQFGMSVTTLLASLFATALMIKKLAPNQSRYVDIPYGIIIKLSLLFQGLIVSWVSFWVIMGQGINISTLSSLATFASAYVPVIIIEVAVNVALLTIFKVKPMSALKSVMNPRLFIARTVY
jgi:hypothetical protein